MSIPVCKLIRSIVLICLYWFALDISAVAQPVPELYSQTGIIHLHNITGDPYHALYPPVETEFPEEFGDVPSITWYFSDANGQRLHSHGHCSVCRPAPMSISEVTTTGFTASSSAAVFDDIYIRWTATGSRLYTGKIVPAYMVLSVIYAPPGTSGGHSTSSVLYSAGSTLGTTTSADLTFKSNVSPTYDQSTKFWGINYGDSGGFDESTAVGYSDSIDIKKTTSASISEPGSVVDGINHDQDEIWLLLKPVITMRVSPAITKWHLGGDGSAIQFLKVGWLNKHYAMPVGVISALTDAGITDSDYCGIIARDPLATVPQNCAASAGSYRNYDKLFNSSRYVLQTTYPYIPPLTENDSVTTSSFSISNTISKTKTTTAEDSYTVKSTVSGGIDFLGYFNAKAQKTNSWEWTNKSSNSSTDSEIQTAQLTIGGPSFGYAGPTVIAVYYDTIYKTFAFRLISYSASHVVHGNLLTAIGAALPFTQVTLRTANFVERTFTDAQGQFEFPIDGFGRIEITAGQSTKIIDDKRPTQFISIREN